MQQPMRTLRFAVLSLVALIAGSARAADVYQYDGVHSSISFKARHLGISWIHGRFNEAAGTFTIDRETPANSKFEMTIQVASVDTANQKRDEHLLEADYFDVKKYPTMDFKSTSVKPIDGGYEVSGDFTMHGTTKPITFKLVGGAEKEWKGTKRVPFSTELTLKRSDYNFGPSAIGPIGDEAVIMIDMEGTRM